MLIQQKFWLANLSTLACCVLLALGCTRKREPGPAALAPTTELPGVDTGALTSRERSEWSTYVSELLSPCVEQAVSLSQCVKEKRDCAGCLPAARYLVEQVRRGGTRAMVEAAYRNRFDPAEVRTINLGAAPTRGPSGAPIVVVEFADFECPACGAVQPILEKVLKKHEGHVLFAFKHFPLGRHLHAEKAARAAVAAMKQGKFWELHHELFTNQEKLEDENLSRYARKVGLELKQFEGDRASEAVADAVNKDRKLGEGLELSGTPSLFINGRPFSSSGQFEQDLDEWLALEYELKMGAAGKNSPIPNPKKTAVEPGDSGSRGGVAAAASAPPTSAGGQPIETAKQAP